MLVFAPVPSVTLFHVVLVAVSYCHCTPRVKVEIVEVSKKKVPVELSEITESEGPAMLLPAVMYRRTTIPDPPRPPYALMKLPLVNPVAPPPPPPPVL